MVDGDTKKPFSYRAETTYYRIPGKRDINIPLEVFCKNPVFVSKTQVT